MKASAARRAAATEEAEGTGARACAGYLWKVAATGKAEGPVARRSTATEKAEGPVARRSTATKKGGRQKGTAAQRAAATGE